MIERCDYVTVNYSVTSKLRVKLRNRRKLFVSLFFKDNIDVVVQFHPCFNFYIPLLFFM